MNPEYALRHVRAANQVVERVWGYAALLRDGKAPREDVAAMIAADARKADADLQIAASILEGARPSPQARAGANGKPPAGPTAAGAEGTGAAKPASPAAEVVPVAVAIGVYPAYVGRLPEAVIAEAMNGRR